MPGKTTFLIFVLMLRPKEIFRDNRAAALKCWSCDSEKRSQQACDSTANLDTDDPSVARPCNSYKEFQDQMLLNCPPAANASTTRVLFAAPDWTKVDPMDKRYRGVCKSIQVVTRPGDPPGKKKQKKVRNATNSNSTYIQVKSKALRYIRYCSWQKYRDSKGNRLASALGCANPSVSDRFDVTTCVCNDRDFCNGARQARLGNSTLTFGIVLLVVLFKSLN